MLAASVREVVGKKEKVVLERSARLELDPKIRVRRNNLKETWLTGEKEEKNEREEKKQKKFLPVDGRVALFFFCNRIEKSTFLRYQVHKST